MPNAPTTPKIAVIGAGLAGLTCAYRLQQALRLSGTQHQLDVYEARPRAGGRVLSVRLNDSDEELGGQNLKDGGNGEHIVRLAEELGLIIESYGVRAHSLFYDERQNRTYDICKELMGDLASPSGNVIERLAKLEAQSNNLAELIDAFFAGNPMLARVFHSRMRAYEGSDTRELSPIYARTSMIWMLEHMQSCVRDLTQNKPSYYPLSSLKGGNSRLIEALAASLGHRLHFKRPVKMISRLGDQLELVFAHGEKAQADIVIFSAPCSVMKDIDFAPDVLPRERFKQMSSLHYGTIAKTIVPVQATPDTYGSFTTDDMIGWLGRDMKNISLYYAGTTGAASQHDIVRRYAHEAKCIGAIWPTLGLPHGNAAPVSMSWANDPYTQGGYSNFTHGQFASLQQKSRALGEQVLETFKPSSEDRCFFAGEHCALEHTATMEGAVESGERSARMVLNRLA
jgi:monoamine oxidase